MTNQFDPGIAGAATAALIIAAVFVGAWVADIRNRRYERIQARLERIAQWRREWLADEYISIDPARPTGWVYVQAVRVPIDTPTFENGWANAGSRSLRREVTA